MVVRRLLVSASLAAIGFLSLTLVAIPQVSAQSPPIRGQKPLRDPEPASQLRKLDPATDEPLIKLEPVRIQRSESAEGSVAKRLTDRAPADTTKPEEINVEEVDVKEVAIDEDTIDEDTVNKFGDGARSSRGGLRRSDSLDAAPVDAGGSNADASGDDGNNAIIELAPPRAVGRAAQSENRDDSGWRTQSPRSPDQVADPSTTGRRVIEREVTGGNGEIEPVEISPPRTFGEEPNRFEPVIDIDEADRAAASQGRDPRMPATVEVIERDELGGVEQPAPELNADIVAEVAPLTPRLIELRDSIKIVMDHYRDRPENIARRSPWGIMHAMIAFEIDSQVMVRGERVNALGWLCWNKPCAGQQLMYVQRGQLRTRNGPGVQGHEGQFLAMLAQCGVRPENELRVNNQSFTVRDLVELEKRTCRPGTELTFKLIGLSYYLDSDEVWTAEDGSKWNISRLIQEELKQPVIGAACGGTHRMMGFSFAIKQRRWEGKEIEGQWLRAQTFVDDFIQYTFRLQNPDGSFSTKWFEGRDARQDSARRIQTTGHILEWLVFAVEDEQLDDPRILKATEYLTQLLWQSRRQRLEIGPQGHALHALLLYEKRRFRAAATAAIEKNELER